MQRELKIELLDFNLNSLLRDKSQRPVGLTVKGPGYTSLNGIDAPDIAPYLMVVVSWTGDVVAEVGKDLAKEQVKNSLIWLVEFLVRHKATRTRINGKKTETRSDLERVLREEIEIGKND